MKYILIVLQFLFLAPFWAQTGLYSMNDDTIRSGHHLGNQLDSIDLAFTNHAATFVGNGIGRIENTLPIDFFYSNKGGVQFRNFSDWKRIRFCALPHLGFGYVFGTRGQQYVSANYQQSFGTKILFNIDYNLQRSTGYLRNSVSNLHDIQLQFRRISTFYSFQFNGQYQRNDFGQSGGVTNDSIIDVNGLAFVAVFKSDAQSRYRGTRLQFDNYFDILAKDSLRSFGLYVESQLRIFNHRYSEVSDTLNLIYSSTNYDSVYTQDQDQLSEAINTIGVFFKSNKLAAKAGVLTNYWNYSNLGILNEAMEIGLDGEIQINIRRVFLKNHTNINFVGARQEWFSHSRLNFSIAKFSFKGFANFSNLLPEQFQRNYFGNHVATSINVISKQFRSSIIAVGEYSFARRSKVGLHVRNVNLVDNYFFLNNQWRNDSLGNLSYLQFGASLESAYKILHATIQASYSVGKFVPSYLIQTRLLVQEKLFKGRKLLAQIGVEGSVHSGYDVLGYLPMLDAYQFGSAQVSPQAINLHAFGAFEVSQFRFFFRVENIGYVWTNSSNLQVTHYPIPAMNIRIGITWDFFN